MEVDPELISKFIPTYPSIDDKKFTYKLASKKEFQDLKLSRFEYVPSERGIPMFHQEIIRRYFSPHTEYTRGLVIHEMGSGKTMESCLIAEYFKYRLIDGKPRPKALVLVPSETLVRNYRKEIVTRCTAGDYDPSFTGVQTERRRQMFIKKAVNKSYEIISFEMFLKRLPEDEELIKKRYNNRVIIIDEIHIFGSIGASKKRIDGEGELRRPSVEYYDKLFHLLHTVENCVIIGLTGTVIWDKTYEFAYVANLFLEKGEQLPVKNKFYKEFFEKKHGVRMLKKEKAIELKKLLKGKISYIRAMTTMADREEIGVVKPWMKKAIIYPCGMSEFQMKWSQKAMKDEDDKGLQYLARNANNFVFPTLDTNEGVYDSDSFNRYVQFKNGIYSFKDKRIGNEIKKNLKKYSSKYAASIEFILEHPDEKVFVYNDFVRNCGGVIVFGLILELFGFSSLRNITHTVDQFKKDTLGKRKRFALISSAGGTINSPGQIHSLLDGLFNDPRNDNGEYCQVIIGTKKLSLGISLKSINQVHIHMPHWNSSEIDQAIFRAFRVGSHDSMPESRRFIKIYKMASVNTKSHKTKTRVEKKHGFLPFKNRIFNPALQSTDLYVYRKAEQKDYSNSQIYRLIKEVAFDCPLTYERNVLDTDKEGSRVCDYEDCDYICDAYPPHLIDKNTYPWTYQSPEILEYDGKLTYYSGKDIDQLATQLKDLFRNCFTLSLIMIKALVDYGYDQFQEILLLRALNKLVTNKIPILNRYGFICFLKEESNVYFLDSNYSGNGSYMDRIYIENPRVVQKSSLISLVEIYQLEEDQRKLKTFCKSQNVNDIKNIHFRTIIALVELAFKMINKGGLSPGKRKVYSQILDKYGKELLTMGDGNTIHSMYASEFTGVLYHTVEKSVIVTGSRRVFDNERKIWYTATNDEEKKYINEIKSIRENEAKDQFKNNPYGIIGEETEESRKKGNDTFWIKFEGLNGRVCKTRTVRNLQEITLDIYLKHNEPSVLPSTNKTILSKSRNELLKLISSISHTDKKLMERINLEKISKEDLARIIILMKTLNKEQICLNLQRWLKEKGLYYMQ